VPLLPLLLMDVVFAAGQMLLVLLQQQLLTYPSCTCAADSKQPCGTSHALTMPPVSPAASRVPSASMKRQQAT
jgi:hypothetical protein